MELGYLFLPPPPSLSFSSGPFPHFSCPRLRTSEQTNERPPNRSTHDISLPAPNRPLASFLCYTTNVTLFYQEPLVLINPPPTSITYPCLLSFLPHFLPVFTKHFDPLQSITPPCLRTSPMNFPLPIMLSFILLAQGRGDTFIKPIHDVLFERTGLDVSKSGSLWLMRSVHYICLNRHICE